MLADSNVPNFHWDFVIEHAALVNSMITPSISDKTKTTTIEADWDVIPNIDLVPPVGCFSARLMDSAREDWKLDPKNHGLNGDNLLTKKLWS